MHFNARCKGGQRQEQVTGQRTLESFPVADSGHLRLGGKQRELDYVMFTGRAHLRALNTGPWLAVPSLDWSTYWILIISDSLNIFFRSIKTWSWMLQSCQTKKHSLKSKRVALNQTSEIWSCPAHICTARRTFSLVPEDLLMQSLNSTFESAKPISPEYIFHGCHETSFVVCV